MVLPLILSLRFLIKEKEKKLFHKTHKTFFFAVIENSPSATCRLVAQPQPLLLFILSVACATRWQDASEWGIVVEKRKL